MIIDVWAQHPTLRHIQDPIFDSLRRWTKTEAPTEPIFFDPYARNRATGSFVLIDEATNNTVGAGMIADPDAPSPQLEVGA